MKTAGFRIAGFVILLCMPLLVAVARAANVSPQFEVASLKRVVPQQDSYQITLGVVRGERLILSNVTLSDCLKYAYGLVSDDQIAGPAWIKSKTVLFDIQAKVQPDTPRDQLQLMMQSLLADRLRLTTHREPRTLSYLALVPAKGGPKMPPAASDPPQPRDNSAGGGRVFGNRMSMQLLATLLSRLEKALIVDNTGLQGEFQVKLQWTPGTGGSEMAREDGASSVSLFTAVQEQLGLRLDSRKGPVDVLVVDHAEQSPSDN
jgi:uncharacterized protein (TIGR03435 family)